MKAIGIYKSLPVEDPDCLVEVEVPTPEPAGRDLLVRVKAVSVNPVDVKVRQRTAGEYADRAFWVGTRPVLCKPWVTLFPCLRWVMKWYMPATSLARM